MKTSMNSGQQISAFADNELEASEHDQVLRLLNEPKMRLIWNEYHHIGDVLRHRDVNVELRPDFCLRLAQRLEAEPGHIRSVSQPSEVPFESLANMDNSCGLTMRRFYIVGSIAAVVAMIAVAVPYLSSVTTTGASGAVGAGNPVSSSASSRTVADADALNTIQIKEYLLAHQLFSPSVYRTAQYGRYATVIHETGK